MQTFELELAANDHPVQCYATVRAETFEEAVGKLREMVNGRGGSDEPFVARNVEWMGAKVLGNDVEELRFYLQPDDITFEKVVLVAQVPDDGCDCQDRGWLLIAPDNDESRAWVERCDSCEVFPGDQEATQAAAEFFKQHGFDVAAVVAENELHEPPCFHWYLSGLANMQDARDVLDAIDDAKEAEHS
jgi:hypothetical protein